MALAPLNGDYSRLGFLLFANYVNKMRHIVTQSTTARTVVTEKSAQFFAELVLEVLDKPCFREGRAVEYRDSFSDGVVRIRRDDDGRIHFRTPRVPEASVRLSPARSKGLLLNRNVGPLTAFLEKNPLLLSFLDEEKLRSARI